MDNIEKIIENTLIPHKSFEKGLARVRQCIDNSHGALEPACIAVIGESRTGKSTLLEECLLTHPRSRNDEGIEIPVLSVKAPSKPTVKGFVEVLLYGMGDPMYDKGTEYTKTNRLKTLMKNAGTSVMMVDEFQHFFDKVSYKVFHHVADWLKVVVDDTKVTLILSGLPSCKSVLNQNEQLAGRFVAAVVLPRFNWNEISSRQEFVGVMGAYDKSIRRFFDIPELFQDDMAFRFYCATGGLIGYLAQLLRQAVWDAVDDQRVTISLSDLSVAYETAIWGEGDASKGVNPFTKEFKSVPTIDLLAKVSQIGVVAMVDGPSKSRGKGKVSELTINNVVGTL